MRNIRQWILFFGALAALGFWDRLRLNRRCALCHMKLYSQYPPDHRVDPLQRERNKLLDRTLATDPDADICDECSEGRPPSC